jgi:light-regulated signal transduction histidine kinase (bacteriophytochrome)
MKENDEAQPFRTKPNVGENATIRKLEGRIRDLEFLLQTKTAESDMTTRELESLSYSISHDIRAPLRAIDGLSLALESDCASQLNEQGKEYLAQIALCARRINLLVDGVLELSRTSRAPLRRRRLDLSAIATEVVQDLRERQPSRNIDVVIEPDMVHQGDAVLIKTVLMKLLDNAWKFTSKKTASRIEVSRSRQDGELVFFVRDSGAGFDMAYADKLFAPFQRLHATGDFPGIGIGLAVAQRIIVRHGGRIWAQSKPDEGTTVYFTLLE